MSGQVHTARRHDSALKHVTGQALYIDDIPEPPGTLHGALVLSPIASGRLRRLDLSTAASAPGVVAVFAAGDIPGHNNIAGAGKDEPLFAESKVEFAGQPLALVVAATLDAARAAVERAVIEIEPGEAILDIATALAKQSYVQAPSTILRGDPDSALRSAPHRLSAAFSVGGQEHFYLEGQIAFVLPGEDGDLIVHSSTQHPTEVQHVCAEILGYDFNQVTTVVRRLGGGFGGKESNASWVAGAAALAAAKTGRPVKLRLPREIDMIATGKRHGFDYRYTVGFDDEGRVLALDAALAADAGWSLDMTPGVVARALTHVDNAYWLPHVRAIGYACRTNRQSNTAFRGFGGPQGMMGIERAMDAIALHLGKDPLDVRLANLYGVSGDVTPYGQTVTDAVAFELMTELAAGCGYRARREAVARWNAGNVTLKRGIALTPVKFGISFTANHLNQAGALVHVYADGSIHLNHGGTEMGQGLNIKVAQVVAHEFQVPLETVKISATRTDKVPNTSATAASSGSDLNGMAAQAAARTIKDRLVAFAAKEFACKPAEVVFAMDGVTAGQASMTFTELVRRAYFARVSLSSTGYYRTPQIHYDRARHQGRPFYYYAYGAACSEVAIDTLTGENRVTRVDILHDVGRSLNPAVDLGQIEGGFIQGMGWLTT
ncbi:MAG: xanthine dehydrogenase large subunit, partial [Rhodospirillaceae bacterium]|nr:xanthine dehydrogenase large subunit [Rhodospirillaceae bacterium]